MTLTEIISYYHVNFDIRKSVSHPLELPTSPIFFMKLFTSLVFQFTPSPVGSVISEALRTCLSDNASNSEYAGDSACPAAVMFKSIAVAFSRAAGKSFKTEVTCEGRKIRNIIQDEERDREI